MIKSKVNWWTLSEFFQDKHNKIVVRQCFIEFYSHKRKNVVIAIYISFIKLLLYTKRSQTKGLEVWSNILRFVVNFVYIWEYHTSKSHQKRSKSLRLIEYVKINTILLAGFSVAPKFCFLLTQKKVAPVPVINSRSRIHLKIPREMTTSFKYDIWSKSLNFVSLQTSSAKVDEMSQVK